MKDRFVGKLEIVDFKGNVETMVFNERKSKGDLNFVTVIVKSINTFLDLTRDELNNTTIKFAYEGDFEEVVDQMFADMQARKEPWMPKLSWIAEVGKK